MLNLQSDIRNAVTPDIVIDELYNERNNLNLRVVMTRNNLQGTINIPSFQDIGILDILNRDKKFFFQSKLNNLADDCNYAKYEFKY